MLDDDPIRGQDVEPLWIKIPYSFSLSSNFGRLVVAMDLRSMIANDQAEPKDFLTTLLYGSQQGVTN